MPELKVMKCGDCGTRIVIMDTYINSLLPVEVEEGKVYLSSDRFDHKIHKSHLINCRKLAERWEKVKQKYFKQRESLFVINELQRSSL